jgi:DNA-directed RNA polymerase subunit RPC12/RpoP
MKEFICGDCRSKIQEKDRLRIVITIPNKTFSEDPKGLAGSKKKKVYKCPYCRGKLFPFGGSKTGMKNLKDKWLYKIVARNAGVGIWEAKRKAFVISRYKFKDNFLFEEFHYAKGPPFGTAFEISGPIEEVPSGDISFQHSWVKDIKFP